MRATGPQERIKDFGAYFILNIRIAINVSNEENPNIVDTVWIFYL